MSVSRRVRSPPDTSTSTQRCEVDLVGSMRSTAWFEEVDSKAWLIPTINNHGFITDMATINNHGFTTDMATINKHGFIIS